MATIQMTHYLTECIIDEIHNRIDKLIQQERIRMPNTGSWGQFIYDTLFGHLKPVLSQIPSEWFHKIEVIDVKQIYGININYSFSTDNGQPWPYSSGQNALAEWKFSHPCVGSVVLKQHPIWDDFYEAITDHKKRVDKLVDDREELICGVKTICSIHKTLNAALETWPALWEFLPKDIKQRCHKSQKYKKQQNVKKLDIDIDRLTAIVVAVKLIGG